MTDMLLVIALGSAVGDATFYPDVPLFEAMLVITAIGPHEGKAGWYGNA